MDQSASAVTVERFLEFEAQSDQALEMVEADPTASPVDAHLTICQLKAKM